MTTHLTGWIENQDSGTAEVQIAGLAETSGYPTVDGDNLRFTQPWDKIALAYAAFDNETLLNSRMRIQSATLDRKFPRFYLPEINDTVEPQSLPALNDFRRAPVQLPHNENVTARYQADTTAAATAALLLWLSQGPITPVDPTGGFWFRYTMSNTAQSARAWTTRTLTSETDLPSKNDAGQDVRYNVLGAVASGVSPIVGRLVFPGQFNRPGFMCRDDVTKRLHPIFATPGQMGVLGQLPDPRTPPSAEILSDLADAGATHDLWLYLKAA